MTGSSPMTYLPVKSNPRLAMRLWLRSLNTPKRSKTMSRFKIQATISETQVHDLLIDADSEAEAIEKVRSGDFDPDPATCRATSTDFDMAVVEDKPIECEGEVHADASLGDDFDEPVILPPSTLDNANL